MEEQIVSLDIKRFKMTYVIKCTLKGRVWIANVNGAFDFSAVSDRIYPEF